MDDELDQIERIFNNAANLRDSAERAAYLTVACQEDCELRARVEKLLRHDAAVGSFLDLPDQGLAVTIASLPLAERPGTQIGPYKLVQEIGEGGMGVVYLAEQAEPVQRQVALKIIKPGMDSREVLARFRAEEQALALMDHPHIAQVHDAGATETGRPYFVMELVRGAPITEYCDDHRLAVRDRLELFVAICQAVQHAHQKGIIHRDIKPSNILVTVQDGFPVPKIIDFGIAKAIHPELTTKTTVTGLGHIVGTPLYMSPEQAEGNGWDIDTRSDIYSLGVLLYELLTGSTPFDRAELRDAELDEVRRLIREQEPLRPSTRVSTLGMAASTVSEHRRTDPVALSNSLRHELDWIVMKALEKDRTRRYETANDFARDIQRYLHDEPVEACPPSTAYRLQKFVRRHQTVVLAITAVGLALIVGAGVAAGQAYRATQAEKVAEEQLQIATAQQQLAEEAATRESQLRVAAEQATRQAEAARTQAEAVTKYLVEAFRSPDPAKDGRTVTVAELLDRAARELDTQFVDQPALKAQLLLALGQTCCGLGLAPTAIPLLERCRDLRQETLGREHPESLRALTALAQAYWQAARYDEALALSAASRELHLRVLGPQQPQTLDDAENRQCALMKSGHYDEAIRLGEELLPAARQTLGPEHYCTQYIMNNLATAYLGHSRYDKATPLFEEALLLARKTRGAKDFAAVYMLLGLGEAYAGVGRFEEALAKHEEALQLSREVLGPEHPGTLMAMHQRGAVLCDAGRYLEAIAVYDEKLQVSRRVCGATNPETVTTMVNLVAAHSRLGQLESALRLSQEALQLCQEHLGPIHRITLHASNWRGQVLLAIRDCDAAATLLDTTVELCRQELGPLDYITRSARRSQVTAYSLLGRHAQATAWGEELLRDTEGSCGPQHEDTFKAMDTLAQSYSAAGRHAEAVALLEKSLPVVREQRGPEHPDTLVHMHDLAVAYHGVGRVDEALALHQETLRLRQKVLGADHPQTLASMLLLGTGYVEQARYAEAEPLLLAAYEGYAQRNAAFPTRYDSAQAREACTQLVQLYEKSNQPDKATAWKEKLAALTEEPKQDEASK